MIACSGSLNGALSKRNEPGVANGVTVNAALSSPLSRGAPNTNCTGVSTFRPADTPSASATAPVAGSTARTVNGSFGGTKGR